MVIHIAPAVDLNCISFNGIDNINIYWAKLISDSSFVHDLEFQECSLIEEIWEKWINQHREWFWLWFSISFTFFLFIFSSLLIIQWLCLYYMYSMDKNNEKEQYSAQYITTNEASFSCDVITVSCDVPVIRPCGNTGLCFLRGG